MKVFLRIGVTITSGVAALYFTFWVASALLTSSGSPLQISFLGSVIVAAAVTWFVWTRTRAFPQRAATCVLLGGLVIGGIGFSAGFFGPMLVMPQANQGPLLGIFITGPLGLLLGAMGGAVSWYAHKSHSAGAGAS